VSQKRGLIKQKGGSLFRSHHTKRIPTTPTKYENKEDLKG
jgi:hypothetical protein